MGLFSGIGDTLAKSKAAVVVELTFEKYQDLIGFEGSPAALANKVIQKTWDSAPDMFNGKAFGRRPHKNTIAASALAVGAYGALEEGNLQTANALGLCLGRVLQAVESGTEDYSHPADAVLLTRAKELFVQIAAEE